MGSGSHSKKSRHSHKGHSHSGGHSHGGSRSQGGDAGFDFNYPEYPSPMHSQTQSAPAGPVGPSPSTVYSGWNTHGRDPSSPRTGSLLAERYRTEMKPYAFAGKAHLDHASPQWQGTYSWSREVGASQPGSASTPATPPSDYVHSSSSGPSSSRHARKGKVKVGKPTHHFHVDGSGQASSSRAGGGGGGQHGTSHHHSSHHHQHHPHPHHHHSHGHSSSRKYRSKRHKDEAGCCAIL